MNVCCYLNKLILNDNMKRLYVPRIKKTAAEDIKTGVLHSLQIKANEYIYWKQNTNTWINAVRVTYMHFILDSFNKYIDESSGCTSERWKYCKRSHVLLQRLVGRVFFSQRLKHQSFFRFCRVDLGRADGDLLEKLIVLQHALKHKEEQRGWRKLRGWSPVFRSRSVSHRQIVDSLRKRSDLPHRPLRVLHLPTK